MRTPVHVFLCVSPLPIISLAVHLAAVRVYLSALPPPINSTDKIKNPTQPTHNIFPSVLEHEPGVNPIMQHLCYCVSKRVVSKITGRLELRLVCGTFVALLLTFIYLFISFLITVSLSYLFMYISILLSQFEFFVSFFGARLFIYLFIYLFTSLRIS